METHLEDVLEPLEGHDDDAGVVDRQGVAERLDAAGVYEAADLVGSAARGRVAEGPGGLLLDVVLGRGEHPNERHDQVGVEYCLDLILHECGQTMVRVRIHGKKWKFENGILNSM